MTPEAFNLWLETIKSAGLAQSDAAAGRLLGISANSVVTIKRNGSDLRTALACAALLLGVKPFGEKKQRKTK